MYVCGPGLISLSFVHNTFSGICMHLFKKIFIMKIYKSGELNV